MSPTSWQIEHPGEELARVRRARRRRNASFDPFVGIYNQQIRAMFDAIERKQTKLDTILGRSFWPPSFNLHHKLDANEYLLGQMY